MTHHGGILSHVLGELVRHAGEDRAARPRRARPAQPRDRRAGLRRPETLSRGGAGAEPRDFGDEILAHPLDDDYHRGALAGLVEGHRAAALRGQLGRPGPASARQLRGLRARGVARQKWLEVHGIEHWTHFYTDYGATLQKRFFDHFLKGEDNGWDKQPRVQLQVRHPSTASSSAHENEWPIARTQWTKLYLDPASQALRREPVEAAASRSTYDALGDGVTFLTAAARARDRDHRPARGEALRLLVDDRCRSLPGAPRVRPGRAGGHVPGRDRSAHADRAGLAARLAPQARPEALDRRTGRTTPTTRSSR